MLAPELGERFRALLRKHVLFSLLEGKAVDDLVGVVDVIAFPFGETVLVEGQSGDCAYLIHSGKARVIKTGADGQAVTLGVLSPGDLFGEQAILHNVLRTASIRAADDLVLFRIRREDFTRLLDEHPALRESVEKLVRQREVMDFLRLKTVLKGVQPRALLGVLDELKECRFLGGETICAADTGPPGLHVIRSGEVRLTRREADGSEVLVGYLGAGEHFHHGAKDGSAAWEQAIAVRETVCLRLDPSALGRLLEFSPALWRELGMGRKRATAAAAPVPVAAPAAPPRLQRLRPRVPGRYPWLPQHEQSDCGAASLAMVARSYGIRLSISRLRELAGTGPQGADLLGLATAAETVGFHCRGVRTDYGHLAGLDLPAVAHWRGYHYVVLYAADAHKVVVGDPAIGVLTLSRAEFEAGWTGRLLLLRPTPRLESQEPPRNTLQRFLPYFAVYRRPLLEALGASLLLELARLSLPVVTQVIVDRVIVQQQGYRLLNLLLFALALLAVVQTAAAMLRQYLLVHVGQRLGLTLRADLFRQVLALPMRAFQSRRVGDFLARFEDSQRIQEILAGRAVSALLDVLVIASSIGLMLTYSVRLSLVALASIPIYVGLTLFFTPLLRRQQRQTFERRALAESALVDALKAIAAIKDAGAELAARWRFEDLIVRQSNLEYRGRRLNLTLDGLFRAVNLTGIALVLWFGARLVLAGELTVGQMIAFNALTAMAAVPILGLTALWFEMQQFFLSLERLNDLYAAPKEVGIEEESADERTSFRREEPVTLPAAALGAPPTAPQLPTVRGLVRFENVSFRYRPEDRNILRNINLEVQPGQTVALVGRSGSGKTTLAMLLQRFYQPTEGRITIDGFDISAVDVRSLRAQVSLVAQETQLLTGSIRDNIALADPDTPLQRVEAAARQANAHEFISSFPLGYDTVVGEMGVRLSGGQKQRLAIARALMKDPRILVLDEATSALDAESERAVQQSLDRVLKGRTVLVIAHRLSTVKNADRIVVLDAGQIVEQGTHQELLGQRGLYHYLVSQQLAVD